MSKQPKTPPAGEEYPMPVQETASLRDKFAAYALTGAARTPIDEGVVGREAHITSIVQYAYAIADAMIAERGKAKP